MKRIGFVVLLGLVSLSGLHAQEKSVDLGYCQQRARENYPSIRQYGLIEAASDDKLSNLSKGYLPQILLTGQATYQSEVTKIPISLPGIDIPSMDKDQYKVALDVSQSIWDGGQIQARRKLNRAEKDVNKKSLEVELYAVRDRVNQLYFGILELDARIALMHIWKEDLQNALKTVEAASHYGVAMPTDVDAVRIELLSLQQQEAELVSGRRAYLDMLSAMMGTPLDENTQFMKPSEEEINPLKDVTRPEIRLFESQQQAWKSQYLLVSSQNLPRLSLFAQGGYGKPGLNMLSNEFDWFGIAGVRLSWNFGNLYSLKNDKRLIATEMNATGIRKETFLFNTNLQLKQAYNDILKSKEVMKQDDEIIALRRKVRLAAQSKYENGVYTVNDLLKDVHNENLSKQSKIVHEIQYLMSIYRYKNISGN